MLAWFETSLHSVQSLLTTNGLELNRHYAEWSSDAKIRKTKRR